MNDTNRYLDVYYCAAWPFYDRSKAMHGFNVAAGPSGALVPPGEMVSLQVQTKGGLWTRAYGAHPGQNYRLSFHKDNGEADESVMMFKPKKRWLPKPSKADLACFGGIFGMYSACFWMGSYLRDWEFGFALTNVATFILGLMAVIAIFVAGL